MNHSPSTTSPLANNGISANTGVSSASETDSPKASRKANLFTTLRQRRPEIFSAEANSSPSTSPQAEPPPDHQLPYKWQFWHDNHAVGDDYEKRLTRMLDSEISTIKVFWQVQNSFPLRALQMRDSVHFFKLGVKPVWEDPRNLKGGAWYFRVPKDRAEAFWLEVLMMAVGDQFADALKKGDDLCGLSYSARFNSDLISIWHRDASNEASRNGILDVVVRNINDQLKPEQRSIYYKRHDEHSTFSDAIAKTKEKEAS